MFEWAQNALCNHFASNERTFALPEKCTKTEFFLVRIFTYLD